MDTTTERIVTGLDNIAEMLRYLDERMAAASEDDRVAIRRALGVGNATFRLIAMAIEASAASVRP